MVVNGLMWLAFKMRLASISINVQRPEIKKARGPEAAGGFHYLESLVLWVLALVLSVADVLLLRLLRQLLKSSENFL